jgi:hypothetical protein
MKIQGTHVFAAPRQIVWDALLDPAVLSLALPGGEQLEKLNDNEYQAAMNVKVGPVQGKFEGKVELADIDTLNRYTMRVSGQGAPGFLQGEGTVLLQEIESGTQMNYTGDVQVGGRIASVGQRLIESTAKSIIRQGLLALDSQVQARAQAAPPSVLPPPVELPTAAPPSTDKTASAPLHAPVAPAAPAPSAAKIAFEVAKDVSRDLLAEVVPLRSQEKLLWFVLGALAMLLFVLLVRLVAG